MFDPILEARRKWSENDWRRAADGMAAVTSIMRAQQIYQRRVDACVKPLGLTFARYELLMLLSFSRSGRLPLSKISERLQVHPTSVTNAADRLERALLARRMPHEEDGRVTLLGITPEGRRVARRATRALNETVFERPGLSSQQTRTLIALLTTLRENAGDLR